MPLKIFTFCCRNGHLFEGWLRDGLDWKTEATEGRLSCPICSSTELERRPDAPNIKPAAGTTRTDTDENVRRQNRTRMAKNLQREVLNAMRKIVAQTENVGKRFPSEVRSMAAGTAEVRPVRGQCTPDEAKRLIEEGCPCMPIPDFLTEEGN